MSQDLKATHQQPSFNLNDHSSLCDCYELVHMRFKQGKLHGCDFLDSTKCDMKMSSTIRVNDSCNMSSFINFIQEAMTDYKGLSYSKARRGISFWRNLLQGI